MRADWDLRDDIKESKELKLVSFIINESIAKFLEDIGFDAKSLTLEVTDFYNPPKIKEENAKNQKEYEQLCTEFSKQIERYAVHTDVNGKKTATKNIGGATISKEKLMEEATLEKILVKIKWIRFRERNKGKENK